jgi:2-iminobutanoate/2-iminopropanoate deaminase
MKKEIVTNNAPAAIGPYSQAIEAGNMVFVSGQLPADPATGKIESTDIGTLTRRSLDNISAILYSAGLTMADVVKTTVFLTNMNDFKEMNTAYASYFGDCAPARSAVEVKALPKNSPIEIEAIAVKP